MLIQLRHLFALLLADAVSNNSCNAMVSGGGSGKSASPATSGDRPPPRIDGAATVATTRWLELQTLSYTDEAGRSRTWDVVTRTTKRSPSLADAVIIIPLLRRKRGRLGEGDPGCVETLIVEQFRPPVGRTTVEFPAGLIDDGETPEDAALRELREETGYVGEKCSAPPRALREMCLSPGLSDESAHVVLVEVDLDNPYNHGTPQQDLDDGEHVIVRRVELRLGLREVLDRGGGMPVKGLYMFALGLELGLGGFGGLGSNVAVGLESGAPGSKTGEAAK